MDEKGMVSLLKDQAELYSYHKLMKFLDGKVANIKDNVVVETDTWNKIMHTLKVMDAVIGDLEIKTPVNGAQGACMQLGCQWNQHVDQRMKNEQRKALYVELCAIVEASMRLLMDLRAKKLVIVEEWWDHAVRQLNQRLEMIRNQLAIE